MRVGLLHGLAAGSAMVLYTVAVRLAWNAPSVTELAADWFTGVLPGPVFDFLLTTLSTKAKPLMFGGLLLAQVLAGGLLGVPFRLLAGVQRSIEPWKLGLAYALSLWPVVMVTLVPAFGGGLFGALVPGEWSLFLLATAVGHAVYGLVLGGLAQLEGARATAWSRREFLARAGLWTVAGGLLLYGLRLVLRTPAVSMSSSGTFRTPGVLSTIVTPNEDFYVVSKNIIDPVVDAEKWELKVTGMVRSPITLRLEDLRAMPSVELYVTLECISNEVGGDLISNALWRGVPLRDLLEETGLLDGVVDVSFRAWDGYEESIPLEKALAPEVLVAYEMNGEPLPYEHGFPARLIVPGRYGLKSVKWLTEIRPVDYDFRGYWQKRGWTDTPIVKTMSRIDVPPPEARLPLESILIGGIAFAGDRGISRVEVSADGGRTWTPAREVTRPLSPYTWVIWRTELRPRRSGGAVLLVRAVDGRGQVQTAEVKPSLPDGATGLHQVRVFFRRI